MQTSLANARLDVVRLIAYYLPQFHPIPENDLWWGKGFTEWTNVAQARPLFPGHYQPHIPADLGFYDLRLPETRQAQADLAREYGIHGFCYYHYWLGGKRLLERPFEEVLASGQPDFPFCLCWANESWTRVWDGANDEHLARQTYSEADDREHTRWLLRAFRDPRYIRVEGKLLFLIYRAADLPAPLRTTSLWRAEARRAGLGELLLCRVESNFASERGDPAALGFDAAVEFQPDLFRLGTPMRRGRLWRGLRRLRLSSGDYDHNHVFDYAAVAQHMLSKPEPPYRRFPCVTPMWDHSPRRPGGAFILAHSTPAAYEDWLRTVVQRQAQSKREGLVFINAWNEWAEGAHLEPDLRHGRAYLEATRRALAVGVER
jgi:lipopolysaccharide biosynthesis protein